MEPESLQSKTCSVDVKKIRSHTICGVCFKPYNDPRILPCLHSFCQQCLQYEIEESVSQQVFKCPTCEKSTSIPVGGASVLPQNIHLGFEVEVAGYVSKIVSNSEVCCDQCIDESSGPAVVFCCTCYQFLCQLCHDHHKRNRQLSKHTMVGLDLEGAKQLQTILKPRDHYCSQGNHEGKKPNIYCETCNCIIHTSRDCIPVGHKDHTITELNAVAKVHRSAIDEVLTHARGTVRKLTGAINGNDKMIEQVEISKRNAHLAIKQAFELLQQTLEERKKTLLSEVEAISLSKTTALTLQKEQFEKMVEDIGHYTEVASHILQTHTDHEVVAIGGLVPTELKATLKQIEAVSLTPNKHSDIHVSVAETDGLVMGLSKFGHVSELSPASTTWTSTSVAMVETKYYVKVEGKTSEGEGYPHGGAQVHGEMRPKAHNGAVVYGEAEDHRDGTYTITFTPQTAGPHQLVITMNGQHVKNSPHDLVVRSKCDYLTLRNAQQVIKCSSRPYCVAIHDSGDIYVGSSADCIYVFDQTGQLKNTIGRKGSGDGQFSAPEGIFIKAAADMLYVADYSNNRVQRLTLGGKFINMFGTNQPDAVIVDKYNRIIVTDYGTHKIHIFSHNFARLLTIDGNGTGNHCFANPYGLALDPQGNIHVAAINTNSIKVFTKEGVYVRMYGDPKCPRGIAIDEEGYSIVSEGSGGNCLSIYDPQGKKIHTVGNLNNPWGTALDPRDGSVYVASYAAPIVLKYCM